MQDERHPGVDVEVSVLGPLLVLPQRPPVVAEEGHRRVLRVAAGHQRAQHLAELTRKGGKGGVIFGVP